MLDFNIKEYILLIYILIINIITFSLIFIDKSKSKNNQWRISENLLILLSLLGGATGSIMSMVIFKHKLYKVKFYIGIPILILLNHLITIILFNII